MKIAFKYGIVTGLALAGWDIWTNEALYDTFAGRVPFIFQVVLLILGIFLGGLEFKKEKYEGKITFGAASFSMIQIVVVAAFVFSLSSYVYYQKGDYNFDEYSIQQTKNEVKKQQLTAQELKQIEEMIRFTKEAENPSNKATGALFVTGVLGIVFAFIFAAILRNTEASMVADSFSKS